DPATARNIKARARQLRVMVASIVFTHKITKFKTVLDLGYRPVVILNTYFGDGRGVLLKTSGQKIRWCPRFGAGAEKIVHSWTKKPLVPAHRGRNGKFDQGWTKNPLVPAFWGTNGKIDHDRVPATAPPSQDRA
ncbi:MAG: hypothetical protein QM270_08480, partial [Bacillota bacterium]|nr:hypothetical protein [Bacillota bacterium]